jgi:hypothetical protein
MIAFISFIMFTEKLSFNLNHLSLHFSALVAIITKKQQDLLLNDGSGLPR